MVAEFEEDSKVRKAQKILNGFGKAFKGIRAIDELEDKYLKLGKLQMCMLSTLSIDLSDEDRDMQTSNLRDQMEPIARKIIETLRNRKE